MTTPTTTTTDPRGDTLLTLARAAITAALGGPPLPPATPEPWLDAPGACFVTLTQDGQLRGCIGNITPQGSLRDAVVRNAQSSALRDPRFVPLSREELPITRIEISLLSPMEPIPADSEEALLAALRPGTDGLLLTARGRSAVFIPSVWEQLPDKRDFLDHLRVKGHFPRDRWLPDTRAERFTAEHWEEPPR
jgi:AmmeMemoRadiSam system protein A